MLYYTGSEKISNQTFRKEDSKMVLKYLRKIESPAGPGPQAEMVERGEWVFIDGIICASTHYDSVCESIVAVLEFENRDPIKVCITGDAYLLNENGKTIEKVRY